MVAGVGVVMAESKYRDRPQSLILGLTGSNMFGAKMSLPLVIFLHSLLALPINRIQKLQIKHSPS